MKEIGTIERGNEKSGIQSITVYADDDDNYYEVAEIEGDEKHLLSARERSQAKANINKYLRSAAALAAGMNDSDFMRVAVEEKIGRRGK